MDVLDAPDVRIRGEKRVFLTVMNDSNKQHSQSTHCELNLKNFTCNTSFSPQKCPMRLNYSHLIEDFLKMRCKEVK